MLKTNERHVRALLDANGAPAFTEIAQIYGKTFKHGGLVATCDPHVVRVLLMDRLHTERRPPLYKLMARLPGADGILFMDGPKWIQRTRAVMPVFHQEAVDSWAAALHELTRAHADAWQRMDRVADLSDAVQQLGLASVLRMGYGVDPEDPRAAALGRALVDYKQLTMIPDSRRLDEFGMAPSKVFAIPKIVSFLMTLRKKTRAVNDAVARVRAERHAPGDRPDWVASLAGAGLTDNELAEELNHLYGAYNAIDYVVAAALYELARRPELTAALRRELLTVLGPDAAPSREQAAQMPFTSGFILEIFRYPVTMGAVRVTGAPVEAGGEWIPANTQVVILLYALHHHPDFWDEPESLKPERWIAGPAPRVPFSYVPFLDGRRKCIGRHMAEMQLLVMLAALVRGFDLQVFGKAVVPPFMIPRFNRPLPFKVTPARLA